MFALVGAIVALRETMQLIADRADPNRRKPPRKLWPELSSPRAECAGPGHAASRSGNDGLNWPWPTRIVMAAITSCVLNRGGKRAGYGYPLAQRQNAAGDTRPAPDQALGNLSYRVGGGSGRRALGALRRRFGRASLDEQLTRLISSVNAQPFGDPTRMRSVAQGLVTWSNKLLGDLEKAPYDRSTARAILQTLLDLKSLRFADYESARDCASILRVVYDDLRVPKDSGSDKQIRKILERLSGPRWMCSLMLTAPAVRQS